MYAFPVLLLYQDNEIVEFDKGARCLRKNSEEIEHLLGQTMENVV